ncbi:roadblock/LC7 domain-containing protein [Streptomyces mirabilis]|uniref:roadblock/LC7 domain-containing protein n=1 Tax=Streptomyces mirabilis TaxID=68239 RepID=UPI0036908CD3
MSWVLDELASAPGARHAVLLSADGLQTATSKGVDRDVANHVAAMASGMQSLSRNGAEFVASGGSPWEQMMVGYKDGFLFIITAAEGAFLAASASCGVDVAAFSYQMATTGKRLGPELAVTPRHPQAERA